MRISTMIFPLSLLALLAGVETEAQSLDSVPTIQPTFTRVFAAEEVSIIFPSLSPNGKWISFSGGDPNWDEMSLWIVPAEGGDAIRLTRGAFDNQPVWLPSGDRLAFLSDRPARGGEGGRYVMSLQVDPETGAPTGPPRQVSIETSWAWMDVSPDGDWVSIVNWAEGRRAILAIPSAGGTSKELAEATTSVPVWGPEGEYLFFSVDQPFSPGEALVRVSRENLQVDTVFKWPEHVRVLGAPQAKYAFRVVSQRINADRVWEVATLDGRPLGRFELPAEMDFYSLTAGGDLLAVREDMATSTEILPIDGGPIRKLDLNGSGSTVLGWTPDGQRLLTRTALDGGNRFFFVSTNGDLMQEIALPGEILDEPGPVLSNDGSRILFAVPDADSGVASLKVFDVEQEGMREVSRASAPVVLEALELSGRGTSWWKDDEDFLYVELRGGDYDLMASPRLGRSRLLRTFQGELPATIAVNADWIAFEKGPRGQRSVAIAHVDDPTPRDLFTFRGSLESITWSRDGTRLAFTVYRSMDDPDRPGGAELIVLNLAPNGDVIGAPSILSTPDMVWWSPHWLPDGRGLLVVGTDGNIWKVSLEAGVDPVPITADLTDSVWWFHISPDGRHMAYERNTLRGSSIWRVGLGAAFAGFEK